MSIQPGTVPTFLVTVSDGNGEIEEHLVQGLPKYRDSDTWIEFLVRRGEATHITAIFPTAKVMSVIHQRPGAQP